MPLKVLTEEKLRKPAVPTVNTNISKLVISERQTDE